MAPRHPLQRLTSPSRDVSLLLHIIGIASFSYNFHFLTVWDTPIARSYGWHMQFLTIIGLSASLIAFVLGALADITLSPTPFQAKNAVAVLATPLEVVISILYWGLRLIDPKLLMPDDFYLHIVPDMGFHLAPAVLLSLDLVLLSPPWTIPAYGIMAISTVIAFAYWYWVELCFSHNGWQALFIDVSHTHVGIIRSSDLLICIRKKKKRHCHSKESSNFIFKLCSNFGMKSGGNKKVGKRL